MQVEQIIEIYFADSRDAIATKASTKKSPQQEKASKVMIDNFANRIKLDNRLPIKKSMFFGFVFMLIYRRHEESSVQLRARQEY